MANYAFLDGRRKLNRISGSPWFRLEMQVRPYARSPAARLIGTPRKRTFPHERWAMDDQENGVGAWPVAAKRPQESGAAALGRGAGCRGNARARRCCDWCVARIWKLCRAAWALWRQPSW